jgi:hypothetical protein
MMPGKPAASTPAPATVPDCFRKSRRSILFESFFGVIAITAPLGKRID